MVGEMNMVNIDLKEILDDFFFCFKSNLVAPRLKESIQVSGIRNPVYVLPAKRGYRLLSGFRRYQAALELELKQIPATIVLDGTVIEEMMFQVLLEQRTRQAFNLIEKAKVLRILDWLGIPWERVKTQFLPLLDLNGNVTLVKDVKTVLTFLPTVQDYIEKYDMSLKQSMVFKHLSRIQQEMVMEIATRLEIRSVELLDMITMLNDISKRDIVPIETIIQELNSSGILNEEKLTRNQKCDRLKHVLRNRRYPRLSSWNKQLEQLKKEMKMPQNIGFSWHPSLETPGMTLQVGIRSLKDVEAMLSLFTDPQNQRSIERMLRIV